MDTREVVGDLLEQVHARLTSREPQLSEQACRRAEIIGELSCSELLGHLEADGIPCPNGHQAALERQVEAFNQVMAQQGVSIRELDRRVPTSRRILTKLLKEPSLRGKAVTLANVAAALETPLFSIGCQGYATNCTFKNVAHTTKKPSQAPPSQSPGNSDATTVRKAPESAKDSLTELERLRLENARLRQEVERRRRADEESSKTANEAPRGEAETPADEAPTAPSTSATNTPIGTPITPAIDPEVIQSDNSGIFIFIPKLRNRSRYFEMEMENRRLRRELNRTTQLLRTYEQVIRQSKQNEVAGAVGMLTGTFTTSVVHDLFGYTQESALGNTLAAVAAIGVGELLSSANPGVASGLRYAGVGMLATDGLTRLYRYIHGSGSNAEQGSATRSKKRAPNFAFLGYMQRTVRPPPNVAKEVSVPTSQDVPESSSPSKAATPTETTDQGPETLAAAR